MDYFTSTDKSDASDQSTSHLSSSSSMIHVDFDSLVLKSCLDPPDKTSSDQEETPELRFYTKYRFECNNLRITYSRAGNLVDRYLQGTRFILVLQINTNGRLCHLCLCSVSISINVFTRMMQIYSSKSKHREN